MRALAIVAAMTTGCSYMFMRGDPPYEPCTTSTLTPTFDRVVEVGGFGLAGVAVWAIVNEARKDYGDFDGIGYYAGGVLGALALAIIVVEHGSANYGYRQAERCAAAQRAALAD
jgi:hypothetical protein